jgi:hypothetical protein
MRIKGEAGVTDGNVRYCHIKMMNTSREYIQLGKNVKTGTAEDLHEGMKDVHRLAACHRVNAVNKGPLKSVNDVRETFYEKLSHLQLEEYEVMAQVLEEYIDLFNDDATGKFPCTTKGFHEIRTGDALPIKKNAYRVPYALKDEMQRQIDEMLEKGMITPCASPWAAPVILVPKKSPDGTPKYRFCTDFRALNAVTRTPVYPIPDIKTNLSLMAGRRYFTLLDIENAYSNIPIKEEDKDKTGFITPFGSYRYERMPFGLSGSPTTSRQRIGDLLAAGALWLSFWDF